MSLRPNSRSCRTASIRSGRAGGLAGELGYASGPAAGAERRRCNWERAVFTQNNDLGRSMLPLNHVIVAIEQARNDLFERARIGSTRRRFEGNCHAGFYVERLGDRCKDIRYRSLTSGDANYRQSAFDLNFGTRKRRRKAAQERAPQPERTPKPRTFHRAVFSIHSRAHVLKIFRQVRRA